MPDRPIGTQMIDLALKGIEVAQARMTCDFTDEPFLKQVS